MHKTAVLIAVASVLFLDLISLCVAIGPTFPSTQLSKAVAGPSSPTKMRIESMSVTNGLDFCSIWLGSSGYINLARYYYQSGAVTVSGISNPPPNATYQDIDVIDGTTDCNVVALDGMKYYVSGETSFSADALNSVAIGVSNLAALGWRAVIRDNTNSISQFSYTFTGYVETRGLSDSALLVAAARKDTTGLFIGTITTGIGTEIKTFPTPSEPRSISIAVYSATNWVVCALTDKFVCVFSSQPTLLQIVSTTSTPTMAAISFADCNNVAYVVANQSHYFLNLVDVTTQAVNQGGYYSDQTSLGAMHMATTQKTTSILLSNSSGTFIDVFAWGFPSACLTEPSPPVPLDPPTSTPLSTPTPPPGTPSTTPQSTPTSSGTPKSSPGTPQNSPNSSPASNSTNNSPNNPGTTNPGTPSLNVDGPKSDNPPKGVDPIALGVGIAVPVAVLGVGAFLLVFFLRRRNKKKKQEKTIGNPVKDIDSPPPSIKPTEPGVYQNLPSNTTNNTYTSLGNVANDSYTTASAAIELPEIDKRLHIPYKSLVFIKEIGAGSYGKVFLGEWRGAKVAIKVNNQITDVDGFLAEAKLTLGIAPHPNLVQTFGVSLDGPNPCIVLEFCGGGSLDLVLYDNNNTLDVDKQREYAMKIAYGLLHLHNNNIVHRDLAARNILLTNDQQPKISDFGMSRVIQEENSKGHTKTNFGPIRWMAPESLRDRSYSVKSDVWSFGIVVNEILSRKEPHVNEDQLSIAVKIRDQAATPEIPSDGDAVLVEVIHKCLKADAKDRPTMEELCQFLRAKLD